MEKFSTWRDKASGEHPFLPLKKPSDVPIILIVPYFILRIFCLPLFFILLFLLYPITWIIPPLHFVMRILVRIILFVSGFHTIKDNWVRTTSRQKGNAKPIFPSSIIISNHLSYLDSLVFYFWSNCLVAHSCPSSRSTEKYSGVLYEPIRYVFHQCPAASSSSIKVWAPFEGTCFQFSPLLGLFTRGPQ
eukprot:TRINITY_DN3645_c0_g1_i2.p1 TRINITY_DN3645_c0_g1~~TRINITY_DN3645_c0_g1_i2.p1  ORF type:complete len:197 (+),score=39.07 TRINITY_DN3645_c0_g1_i2:25-591(+)